MKDLFEEPVCKKSKLTENDGNEAETTVTFLHFNDVYNIGAVHRKDGTTEGGLARFAAVVRGFEHLDPIVVFSGDAFFPSQMSVVLKGKQMIPALTACNVTVAMFGNHEFDLGVETAEKLAAQCDFPWLLSNVHDRINDTPLGNGQVTLVLERQGIKFGLMGLAGNDFVEVLGQVNREDVIYTSFVDRGRELARQLRQQGCDYVIALTHMRWPDDIELAEQVPEIDLILGGHDHDYGKKMVNNTYILKSGVDFKELSKLTLKFNPAKAKTNVTIEQIVVTPTVDPEPKVHEMVAEKEVLMKASLNKPLGHIGVDLDCLTHNIRVKETNLGNFVADIMRRAVGSDVAFINSGALRSNRVHPKGLLMKADLFDIMPYMEVVVLCKVTGEILLQAFENSVSTLPLADGRFLQISGARFKFDPSKNPGERLDRKSVCVQGKPIDANKVYTLATSPFILSGRNGYESLENAVVQGDPDDGPSLQASIFNFFRTVRIVMGFKAMKKLGHRQLLLTELQKQHIHEYIHCETKSGESLVQRRWRSILRAFTLEKFVAHSSLHPQVQGRIKEVLQDVAA